MKGEFVQERFELLCCGDMWAGGHTLYARIGGDRETIVSTWAIQNLIQSNPHQSFNPPSLLLLNALWFRIRALAVES